MRTECWAPAIRSERRGGVHEVALAGELDVATANAFEHELTAVEATDADRIIIDLARWTSSPAPACMSFSAPNARCGADGGRLRLLQGPPQVQRMFEITGTADRLPFAD